MKKPLIMLMLLASHNTMAQGRLPACPALTDDPWTNCSGQLITPGGDTYIGDFWNGMRHGQGSY